MKKTILALSSLIGILAGTNAIAATDLDAVLRKNFKCINREYSETFTDMVVFNKIKETQGLEDNICEAAFQELKKQFIKQDALKCFNEEFPYSEARITEHRIAYDKNDIGGKPHMIIGMRTLSSSEQSPCLNRRTNIGRFSVEYENELLIESSESIKIVPRDNYELVISALYSKNFSCSIKDSNQKIVADMTLEAPTHPLESLNYKMETASTEINNCTINPVSMKISCKDKNTDMKLSLYRQNNGSVIWDTLCSVMGGVGCDTSDYFYAGTFRTGSKLFGKKHSVVCKNEE